MYKLTTNRNAKILLAALALALLFHVSVLYHLHHLPLSLLSMSGAWAPDRRHAKATGERTEEERRDLKEIFHSLTRPHPAYEPVKDPAEMLSREVDSLVTRDLIAQEAATSTTSIDMIISPSSALREQRAAAADQLLGEIELQMQSVADDAQKLQIGSLQELTTQATAHSFQEAVASALESAASTSQDQLTIELPSTMGQRGEGRVDEITQEGTIASSNDFQLAIEYAPRQNGQGYLFRLTLTPKPEVIFRRIAHNVFFLLDRSSSISRARYDSAKLAVRDALTLLHPGDRFNILVFDDHVVALSPQALPVYDDTIAYAEQFLAQQPHGGLFAATNLYASLGDIIPEAVAPQEVNTAILFSDGDTPLSLERQRQTIASWTAHNAGKVALFSVAVGIGNNLPLLDLLTTCNRGYLCYLKRDSDNRQALLRLFSTIRTPIGKEIVATPVVTEKDKQVTLYPPANRQPHLYRETPYVVYGSSNDLRSFYLFLQGRYYDKWLDIKQLVSFQKGVRVPLKELEGPVAREQALNRYESYLRDGNPQHLAEVKTLLQPHGIPTAFQ